MSKKSLARTAIEGGRHNGNKWDRRNSHTEERNSSREYCKRVIQDPEYADEDLIEKKTKVYKEFTDKLSPMYRWLRSQVGRYWNDVRSEVSKKFDTRTTAGRHIVFDHLLSSVETESTPLRWYRLNNLSPDPNVSYFRNDFYVDEEGILKERRYVSRKYRRPENINTPWVAKWLNGRIVGRRGQKLYWFVPAATNNGWVDEWKCQWDQGMPLKYLYRTYESVYNPINMKSTYKPVWREPFYFVTRNISARQDAEFSKDDYEVWKEIPIYYQDKILEMSPINK
jgi:hypothetical protein